MGNYDNPKDNQEKIVKYFCDSKKIVDLSEHKQ